MHPQQPSRPAPLSRSASSSSVITISDDGAKSGPKRTRKRFSQEQLIVLEQLFRVTSHPSKWERQAIAKQAGMDNKSVTVWFQNKRQAARKALHNSTNRGDPLASLGLYPPTAIPPRPLSAPTFSSTIYNPNPVTQRRNSTTSSHQLTSRGFLSLDRIASRTEQARPCSPHTPPAKLPTYGTPQIRTHEASVPLWDAMPSSPLQPNSPCSPFSRDILDFAAKRSRKTSRRSLEWACASAHMTEKAGGVRELPLLEDDEEMEMGINLSPTQTLTDSTLDGEETDVDSTDGEEPHEIITPDTSQASISVNWKALDQPRKPFASGRVHVEDDIMNAAWALCGLSAGARRT